MVWVSPLTQTGAITAGSKITLDYSHYILQYIPVERIHKMIPYAGHVHIRQATEGKLHSRYNDGVIDSFDFVDFGARYNITV